MYRNDRDEGAPVHGVDPDRATGKQGSNPRAGGINKEACSCAVSSKFSQTISYYRIILPVSQDHTNKLSRAAVEAWDEK